MHKNIINDLEYHYVYKIIHIPTGRYYIGIHSTNNLNDGYRGSGRIIKNMYKKHPIIEFVKEILYYGESRDDILKKETELVTEEILKKDPLILNLDIGGRSGNKIAVSGIISVKDKDGNILKVSNNDPRYLSGELQHINKGNKYNVSYKPLYKDGVALCRPMTIEDTDIEYKAIEAKAKQQFGLKLEQSWPDFRDDIESPSDQNVKYVLFHETGNKSKEHEIDTYWILVGEPGVMKIEKL